MNNDLGEFLGITGLWFFGFIVFRSLLKYAISQRVFVNLKIEEIDIEKIARKVLVILTKLHVSMGVLAVFFIYLHCFSTGFVNNIFLRSVLILFGIMLFLGISLKIHFGSAIKRFPKIVKLKLILTFLIIMLAGLGHMIMDF